MKIYLVGFDCSGHGEVRNTVSILACFVPYPQYFKVIAILCPGKWALHCDERQGEV